MDKSAFEKSSSNNPSPVLPKKFVRFDSKLDPCELEQALDEIPVRNVTETPQVQDIEEQGKKRSKAVYMEMNFWVWFFAVFFLLLSLYRMFYL